jgi:hypothetical protein
LLPVCLSMLKHMQTHARALACTTRVHGALGTVQLYTGAAAVPVDIHPANDSSTVYANAQNNHSEFVMGPTVCAACSCHLLIYFCSMKDALLRALFSNNPVSKNSMRDFPPKTESDHFLPPKLSSTEMVGLSGQKWRMVLGPKVLLILFFCF